MNRITGEPSSQQMRQQTFEEGKNCIEIGLGGDRTTRAVVLNLFMARGTLGQLYQYLAAPLDAKIDLKIRKLITGGTLMCRAAPWLRTIVLETQELQLFFARLSYTSSK